MRKCALSIAGFDPSAGAGVLADVETFGRFGFHGLAVVTALTAQNSRAVRAAEPVRPRLLKAQLDTLAEDFTIRAVKIGLLADVRSIEIVADFLERLDRRAPVVLDPVLKAKSGFEFGGRKVTRALARRLFPLCDVVTPNADEAAVLAGTARVTDDNCAGVLSAVRGLGPAAVVLKGGHLEGETVVDYVLVSGRITKLQSKRIDVPPVRGLGCRHSSAMAALLGSGFGAVEAARKARDYIRTEILVKAEKLGRGALYYSAGK